MKVLNCKFDPEKDLREVDQFGHVDLHDAFVNSAIPSDLQAQVGNFNNIDDPSLVRPRPADVFEGMQAEKSYARTVFKERSTAKSGENS